MKTEPHSNCGICPRLKTFRLDNKKSQPEWFNAPVPSFGNRRARLLIVGLAPGMGGANRTGRPFTGDYAGKVLYEALDLVGLSQGRYEERADDGLQLAETMITNAVRCVPPQNKPMGEEIANCRRFLEATIANLPRLQVILTLGKIAHDSTIRTLGLRLSDYPFGHENEYHLTRNDSPLIVMSSYHCSRYNINTGRLTPKMFNDVLVKVNAIMQEL